MPASIPYPRILNALRQARMAAMPDTTQVIIDALRAHSRNSGGDRGDAPKRLIHDEAGKLVGIGPAPAPDTDRNLVSFVDGVAVVRVHGIIGKNLSLMETSCGGRDVDAIGADIFGAVNRPDVTSIVLDIDSPGGTVTGIPELAAKIREWSGIKPIFAYTSNQACSAAYWIASACSAVFASPSSVLGSIGVYVAIIDDSVWFENQGFQLQLIKAGTQKAAVMSGLPLAPEARAAIQADVDDWFNLFTTDISTARPEVAPESMDGQTFRAPAALAAGLIDEIHPDLASAVQAVTERVASGAKIFRVPAVSNIPGSFYANTSSGRAAHARHLFVVAQKEAFAKSSVTLPALALTPAPIAGRATPATAPAVIQAASENGKAGVKISKGAPAALETQSNAAAAPTDAELFTRYSTAPSRAEQKALYQKHGDAIWRGYLTSGRKK